MVYFDSYGLVVQADLDGGDTFARHWTLRGLVQGLQIIYRDHSDATKKLLAEKIVFPNSYEQDLKWFEPNEDGVFIRNPEPNKFWSDPARFSRDQTRFGVIAWGLHNDNATLKRFMKRTLERGLFCQNKTDWYGAYLSDYWRARGFWFLWPLICLFDLTFVVDALNRIGILPRWKHETREFVSLNSDDVGDDWALFMSLTFAALRMSTPTSWFARKIYAKFRPPSEGTLKMGVTNTVAGALAWYCRKENNGNPEIAEMATPYIERFFS